ncbi:MAG: B12-binding domain-containing radical SAM protein [Spirochaetales bacterium]|nr:B12-binding domain-containing radical SAM protein [Spirochaetales bacterium]
MQNILLVEPQSSDFNIFSMFKIPRMGLAILGTQARKAGYSVRIIYQESTAFTNEQIMWADLIGFSIITSTAPEGYRMANMVKALNSSRVKPAIIIFGGVHATFKPEEALSNGDYVLRGEADNTFVPFLDALKENKSPSHISGLSYKNDKNQIIHNPLSLKKVDMNTIPTPDFSLFENYKPTIGIVMTSRGCPYNCSFCSVTEMLGHKYRMRSIDRVMEDVASLKSENVFFYDDHFTADRKRTKQLLIKLIEFRETKRIYHKYSAQVRSDIARDPEMLTLMKKAGFQTLYIGFESVNPQTLLLYNKGQTLNDIEKSIEAIHSHGIEIHGMFVFGSDADGPETFKETLLFAKKTRIETVQFLILTPLPGTPFYKELETHGRILYYDWDRFDAFNATFLPKKMSPYELQVGTLSAMKKFYSPLRAFNNLIHGDLRLFLLRLYGRITLYKWGKNNKKRIRTLKKDSHEVFIPGFMKTYCPLPKSFP